MKTKTTTKWMICLALIPFFFSITPEDVSATPIEAYDQTFNLGPVTIDVSVYNDNSFTDDYSILNPIFPEGNWLYVYDVTSKSDLYYFVLERKEGAEITEVGSATNDFVIANWNLSALYWVMPMVENPTDTNPTNLLLYVSSPMAPQLLPGTVQLQDGTVLSGGPYWGPDPPVATPEPTTLLLVGSGLIGLAGLRKRFLNKKS